MDWCLFFNPSWYYSHEKLRWTATPKIKIQILNEIGSNEGWIVFYIHLFYFHFIKTLMVEFIAILRQAMCSWWSSWPDKVYWHKLFLRLNIDLTLLVRPIKSRRSLPDHTLFLLITSVIPLVMPGKGSCEQLVSCTDLFVTTHKRLMWKKIMPWWYDIFSLWNHTHVYWSPIISSPLTLLSPPISPSLRTLSLSLVWYHGVIYKHHSKSRLGSSTFKNKNRLSDQTKIELPNWKAKVK